MNKTRACTTLAWTLSILSLAAAAGCDAELEPVDESAELAQDEKAIISAGPDLLWQNIYTGEVSAWLINGTTVLGTKELDWRCGAADGCSSVWKPIDTGIHNLLWYNATTGVLQDWLLELGGVIAGEPLSWKCDTASGCAAAWRPIARGWYEGGASPNSIGNTQGVMWHNATTGEVGMWDLDLNTPSVVVGSRFLSWRCRASDGCSQAWKAVLTADFNKDGWRDLLWYNATTGQVSAWLLDGNTVTGTQEFTWRCDKASGCADAWRIVDAADTNSDGFVDLTWHNPTSGQVSTWIMHGDGIVTGANALSWTCGSECSSAWKPIGYVYMTHTVLL